VASTLQHRLGVKNRQRIAKRSSNSTAKVAVYASVFVVLAGVIALGYDRPASTAQGPKQLTAANAISAAPAESKTPSVDAIVANNVAASLTEQANLPIATTVANTSVSLAAQSELAQADDTVIAKPQIVQMDESGRSVQVYKTKAGDTVDSIAKQFGVSAETIRWANNIVGDALEPNRDLKILPVSGVLHNVKDGESVASIAAKYGTSEARIKLLNDLDLSNPVAGQQIIVPDGQLPETERPGYQPPVRQQSQAFGGGSGNRISTNVFATAGNKYAPGNCTWYVYERRAQLGRPIGSYWGNANTWAYSARAAGFPVDNNPAAGSILVDTAGYFGHVGVVESVKENGDIVITEMNNYAYGGFNIVNSRTISAGQASAYQYIH
jgi:surface antigen/uncharacterized protein (DUF433 family)